MDPLSITASVVGLTATCLRAMKAMNDLKGKFQNANLTITAICTETLIISTSLSQIQSSMLGSPDELSSKLSTRPDLKATLDHALIGCYVVFDVLHAEIKKLTASTQSSLLDLSLRAKLRYLWNEKMMQDILQQIRGLQTALTLLLQLLGTNDLAELKQILNKNTLILSQIVQRTSHFRTVKSSSIPESVFDLSFDMQRINRDDSNSMIGSTFFSFDDEIVNSHTYRRVLTKAYAMGDNINGSQSQSAVNERKAESTAADETLGSTLNPIVNEWLDPTIEKTQSLTITKTPIANPKSSTSSSTSNTKSQTFTENIARSLEVNEKDVRSINQTNLDYQIILYEILSEEKNYLKELENLLHDLSILSKYPDARRKEFGLWGLNMDHLMSLFDTCGQIYQANQEYLYDPLNLLEISEGPLLTAILDSFQNWIKKSSGLYGKYAYHSPHGNSLMLRVEQLSMVTRTRINHAWLYYLRRPLCRIKSYESYLRRILEISESSIGNHEFGETEKLLDKLKHYVESCCLFILPVSKLPRGNFGHKKELCFPGDTNVIYKKWMLYETSFDDTYGYKMVLIIEKPSRSIFILKETKSGSSHWEKELEVWDELRGSIQFRKCNPFKAWYCKTFHQICIDEIVGAGTRNIHKFYLKDWDEALRLRKAIEVVSEGAKSQDSL